jgi:hypothetical protein
MTSRNGARRARGSRPCGSSSSFWLWCFLRRHHRGHVFRPDLASLSDRARRSGPGPLFASTQRLEVRTPEGARLAGMRIPSEGATAEGAPALLGFGGNAWNAEAMALILHALFPHRDVVAFHYRGYPPSSGRPSAGALFSDSLVIFDHRTRLSVGGCVLPVGFSIGAAVAAYLARHRSVAGLILVTPFDSHEVVARDLYCWAPVGPLLRNRTPTIEIVRGSKVSTALLLRGALRSCRGGAAQPFARRSKTWCSNTPSTRAQRSL